MEKLNNEECREMVLDYIENGCKKYFKCSEIVDSIEMKIKKMRLQKVLNERRKGNNLYFNKRKILTGKVRYILVDLKKNGKIERYNKKVWKKHE